ncbi:hypothetical protein [Halodesulfovibrio marinisediminis]|uniref:AlgX/AlgJ SGNH hydrolase-like domain-containing protein n=1 Tax=Halodesulfovibrio marinisediminis DSM 17456 TaxID=1121457 RepID=A0A1N6JBQ7_9BACT|nr:hypothetical protein [Halodesulfovibrio marinisediminis]SIO41663.1 hypothetical protein SAMN02745161_3298 [Halodesulfovibrio marinisediminis DSM 17456]
MLKQVLIGVVCAVVFSAALATYGVFDVHIIAYALAIWAVACMFMRGNKALYITGAFVLVTLVAWGGVSISGLAEENATTPEQYLAEYNPSLALFTFAPSRQLQMKQTAGLLARIDSRVEPVARDISFVTDKNGLRNSNGVNNPNVLLIGGSFVVGNGNTQSSLISDILRDQYSVEAYNIATPGSLDEQAFLALMLMKEQQLVKNGVLFVFEGEDFKPFSSEVHYPLKRLVNYLGNNELGRLLREYRGDFLANSADSVGVVSYPIGGSNLAFSEAYVAETLVTKYEADPKFEELLASLSDKAGLVKAVVFVPTKYRVYASLLGGTIAQVPESPKLAALRAMSEKHVFKVYDLTPHLQAKAIAEWGQRKQLIWWTDDVYWNESGAEVAAELVKEILLGNK